MASAALLAARKYWWKAECAPGPEGKPCRQKIIDCTRSEGGSMLQMATSSALDTALGTVGNAVLPVAGGGLGAGVSELVGQFSGLAGEGVQGGCEKYRNIPAGAPAPAAAAAKPCGWFRKFLNICR